MKKRIGKIIVLVVFGIFVAIILTPLILAAPNWNNGTSATESYYIAIDSDNNADDQVFAVFKNGAPGAGPETELFRVGEDGHFGIGTSTPYAKLVVYGDADESYIYFQDQITGDDANDVGFCVGLDTNQNGKIWNFEDADIRFGTDNSEKMTIKSDGKVGIGTTGPSYELDVNGDTKIKDWLYVAETSNKGITFLSDPLMTSAYDDMKIYLNTDNDVSGVGSFNIYRGGGVNQEHVVSFDFGNAGPAGGKSWIMPHDTFGIGIATPETRLHVSEHNNGDNIDLVTFERTTDDAADDDSFFILFKHGNDNAEQMEFANMRLKAEDVTDDSEDGELSFTVIKDGTTELIMVMEDEKVGIGGIEDPIATLDVHGGFATEIYQPASYDYSIDSRTVDDHTLICAVGDGALTKDIDLPEASTCVGRILVIRKLSGTNTLRIDAAAGDTIEGAGTYTVALDKSYMIQCYDDDTWYIIADF